MTISRSNRKLQGKAALNPQQQRAFTRTEARDTTPGITGVGASAPPVGPRTNWAELESKAQQGRRRSDTPASAAPPSDKQVKEELLKVRRRRPTGRTLAQPGLKARASGHAGVKRRHQTGTT